MARLSRKHSVKILAYNSLHGGINTSVSPEMIADNEMAVCDNFEYDVVGNKLRRRGGISAPVISFPATILGVFYDFELNAYLVFLTNREIYYTNLSTSSMIGTLTGSLKPICCKFGGQVVIASGDKLQTWDSTTLSMIDTSPFCDIVFERFGRVVVARAGDDYLYYSAVGDVTDWDEDRDQEGAAMSVEVGYQDGGDIVSILPLFSDLFVFKSNGKIFQVSNEPPDWVVLEVGQNADVDYRFATANIGNYLLFVGKRGLMTLEAVQQYGNVRTNDIGDRFNSLIRDNYRPEIWHLKRKRQILIRPHETNEVIAFHYALGAATRLIFPSVIVDAVESPAGVVLASGNSLFYWGFDYHTDHGITVSARLKTKTTILLQRILVTNIYLSVSSDVAGSCLIVINKMKLTLPWLENSGGREKRFRTHYSSREMAVEISSDADFCFDNMLVEVTEI